MSNKPRVFDLSNEPQDKPTAPKQQNKQGSGKKRNRVALHGWINLNKPTGITSTKALAQVQRALNAEKAGHGGTLDPLATGVLPIALGEATKTVAYMQDCKKSYRFTVQWGEERTTDDSEGEVISTSPATPTPHMVEQALLRFVGQIEQIPPLFSAIKVEGARAYDLARAGQLPELKSRLIDIYAIAMTHHDMQQRRSEIIVHCGKGTYVRSIARDLGRFLECFGHICQLERTSVGPFTLEDAISLDSFSENVDNDALGKHLHPLATVLTDISVLALTSQEAVALRQGRTLTFISRPDFQRLVDAGLGDTASAPLTALATCDGREVGLINVEGATIKTSRLFNL